MPKPSDLLQGTLDLLILRMISREPLHGWGIAKRMQLLSGDVLSVGQGSLIRRCDRLQRQGWIQRNGRILILGERQRFTRSRAKAANN